MTWSRICKGVYEPTKNLLFSLALTVRMTQMCIRDSNGVGGEMRRPPTGIIRRDDLSEVSGSKRP